MKNDTPTKSIRVQITLGDIPLNVYQLPDGTYKLSGRNVTDAIGEAANSLLRIHGVKSLKSLPGAGLDCYKIHAGKDGVPFIPVAIQDAVVYWGEMSRRGNVKANAILVACAIEAIERRADHALGVLIDEKERNARMELRMKRLLARHQWTDTLKDRHQKIYGRTPTPDQYKKWTIKANLALFERPHFNCDRDTMTLDEQLIIEQFEFTCCRQAKKHPHATPDEILAQTLNLF